MNSGVKPAKTKQQGYPKAEKRPKNQKTKANQTSNGASQTQAWNVEAPIKHMHIKARLNNLMSSRRHSQAKPANRSTPWPPRSHENFKSRFGYDKQILTRNPFSGGTGTPYPRTFWHKFRSNPLHQCREHHYFSACLGIFLLTFWRACVSQSEK